MKYPYWNEYDNAKKWKAVAAELSLETNNATTKADLTNMVKFLGQEAARLQAEVYKAEAEVERLQKVYAITNESWKKQVEENAQLRKVVKAANDGNTFALVQALAELDEEGD